MKIFQIKAKKIVCSLKKLLWMIPYRIEIQGDRNKPAIKSFKLQKFVNNQFCVLTAL